eukprot:12354789-Alexandrium_andersonii.AAC.1
MWPSARRSSRSRTRAAHTRCRSDAPADQRATACATRGRRTIAAALVREAKTVAVVLRPRKVRVVAHRSGGASS